MKPITSLILTGILSLIFLGHNSMAESSVEAEDVRAAKYQIIR